MGSPHNDFDNWDRANQRDADYAAYVARNLDEQDFRNFTHQLIAEFMEAKNDNLMRIVRQFIVASNECGDTPMGDYEGLEDLAQTLTDDLIEQNMEN